MHTPKESAAIHAAQSDVCEQSVSRHSSPEVSIALCTYNGERFLGEQLDSLLAQTHQSLEIVAVDDSSQDRTIDILQRYAQRDRRIRIFQTPRNVGYRRNFEIAMLLCHGDFIALCDQDDIWSPNKLHHLLQRIGTAPMIYSNSELVDEVGNRLGIRMSDKLPLGAIDDPLAFTFSNCVSGHSLLIRRDLLHNALPLPDGLFHDWWLAFVAASRGGIVYCDAALVRYRQHSSTITDVRGARRLPRTRSDISCKADSRSVIERRVALLAAFSVDADRLLLEQLLTLLRAREGQWLCPSLTMFLFRHRRRFFALLPHDRLHHWARPFRFLWGVRFQQLIQHKPPTNPTLPS